MEGVGAVGSQDGDDIAGAGVGDLGDVYDHLVHADIADDVGFLSSDEDGDLLVGEASRQAVGVAYGDGGDAHGGLGTEVSSVADGFAGTKFFDDGDSGVEGEDRTQGQFHEPGIWAAVAAVHGDAETGVVEGQIRVV